MLCRDGGAKNHLLLYNAAFHPDSWSAVEEWPGWTATRSFFMTQGQAIQNNPDDFDEVTNNFGIVVARKKKKLRGFEGCTECRRRLETTARRTCRGADRQPQQIQVPTQLQIQVQTKLKRPQD